MLNFDLNFDLSQLASLVLRRDRLLQCLPYRHELGSTIPPQHP